MPNLWDDLPDAAKAMAALRRQTTNATGQMHAPAPQPHVFDGRYDPSTRQPPEPHDEDRTVIDDLDEPLIYI